MTCLDFENRLQELCDLRQRELPDELAAHVAHCAACREMQECVMRLQDSVTAWRAPSPPAELVDVVLRRLQADRDMTSNDFVMPASRPASVVQHGPNHRHGSPLTGWMVLLASALALVIAVGIGWRVSSNVLFAKRQTSSQTQIATTPVKRPESASTPPPAGDRELDVLLHDARDAYVALASQAWQQVSTADVLLPPADTPNPFGGEGSADDVSESLSRPLAPLGKELREAVDSWLQHVFHSQDSST
jgi:hypothetical protein